METCYGRKFFKEEEEGWCTRGVRDSYRVNLWKVIRNG